MYSVLEHQHNLEDEKECLIKKDTLIGKKINYNTIQYNTAGLNSPPSYLFSKLIVILYNPLLHKCQSSPMHCYQNDDHYLKGKHLSLNLHIERILGILD